MPRGQHPVFARCHDRLRGLTTAIHEISGLGLTEDGIYDLRLQLGAGLPFVLIVVTLSRKLMASIYKLLGFLLLA